MLHRLGQGERAQEVAEIVGQCMKLKPDGIVAEPSTREARPLDGVLALLDVLLSRATPIVEGHHPLGRPAEIGDDEPDTGKQLAGVPLHLGHDAAGLVPALGPVAEAGVVAPYMIGRTADRSREQVRDAFLQHSIGGKADRGEAKAASARK